MQRQRRAHVQSINPWPCYVLSAFVCISSLQLLLIHEWRQHDQHSRVLHVVSELSRVSGGQGARAEAQAAIMTACLEFADFEQPRHPVMMAVSLARQSGQVVPCRGVAAPAGLNLSACEGKCIIAANLHNSEEVLPNMLVQLVRAAHLLGPANLLVSIYDSGSTDATATWLDLLRGVLDALSVRHIVTAGGSLTRRRGQDRIAFLASVRQATIDQVLLACDGGGAAASGFCAASRIVFINDVFFDAEDVVRLLQYGGQGYDLACGMDFEPILADLPVPQQREFMAQHLQRIWRTPQPLATTLASWQLPFRLWKRAYRRSDSLLGMLPLFFYDVWVARDITGTRLHRPAPYASHAATAGRLRGGLPVEVYCCWNGMTALSAEPLLTRAVAFRAAKRGSSECAASECSLLCDDLRRVGRGAAVLDPAVRVAYRAVAARRLFGSDDNEGSGVGSMSSSGGGGDTEVDDLGIDMASVEWNEKLLEGLAVWRRQQTSPGLPQTVECCALQPGSDAVDFERGCSRVPVPGSNGGGGGGV